MRYLITSMAILLLTVACETTSTSTSGSRDELTEAMIKIATAVCASGLDSDEEVKKVLKVVEKKPREVCDCTYKKFFAEMTDAELDRFIGDSQEYGDRLGEQEPWKTRIFTTALVCVGSEPQSR